MRSVVVLPASMCAMIPMFRVFSSGKVRAIRAWSCGSTAVGEPAPGRRLEEASGEAGFAHKKGPFGPRRGSRLSPKRLYRAALHGLDSARAQRMTLRTGDG